MNKNFFLSFFSQFIIQRLFTIFCWFFMTYALCMKRFNFKQCYLIIIFWVSVYFLPEYRRYGCHGASRLASCDGICDVHLQTFWARCKIPRALIVTTIRNTESNQHWVLIIYTKLIIYLWIQYFLQYWGEQPLLVWVFFIWYVWFRYSKFYMLKIFLKAFLWDDSYNIFSSLS